MRLARREDRDLVVNILIESFKDYGHINWVLRTNESPKRLKDLYCYIFDENMEVGKIYINEDNNAVAIWNSKEKNKFNLKIIFAKLNLLLQMGFPIIKRLIQFEKLLSKGFPETNDFFYLQLLAVLPEFQGKGHARKLLLPVVKEMRDKGISIYLETIPEKNVKFYEKLGFSVISVHNHGEFNIYIMKTDSTTRYKGQLDEDAIQL